MPAAPMVIQALLPRWVRCVLPTAAAAARWDLLALLPMVALVELLGQVTLRFQAMLA